MGISRLGLWSWVYHGCSTKDGQKITPEYVDRIIEDEAKNFKLPDKNLNIVKPTSPSRCASRPPLSSSPPTFTPSSTTPMPRRASEQRIIGHVQLYRMKIIDRHPG